MADDRVGDDDVVELRRGEYLGLGNFGGRDPVPADVGLERGDLGNHMRLDVGSESGSGSIDRCLHGADVGVQFVEVNDLDRGVEIVDVGANRDHARLLPIP